MPRSLVLGGFFHRKSNNRRCHRGDGSNARHYLQTPRITSNHGWLLRSPHPVGQSVRFHLIRFQNRAIKSAAEALQLHDGNVKIASSLRTQTALLAIDQLMIQLVPSGNDRQVIHLSPPLRLELLAT